MNATREKDSTRNRIQETALRLFAEQGYDATSVRDIAQAAEVNVASINYHFGTKAGLYSKAIEASYCILSDRVEEIAQVHAGDTADLVIAIFQLFQQHSESLVNTFKVFLSKPKEVDAQHGDVCMDGPPGHLSLKRCIQGEVGGIATPEDLQWAAGVLFTHVVHLVLLQNSHVACRPEVQGQLQEARLETELRRLTRCVVTDLRRK